MPEAVTPGQLIYSLIILALFAASPVMALLALLAYRSGRKLVPFEVRPRPRLTMADVALPFLVFVVFILTIVPLLLYMSGFPLGTKMADLTPDAFLKLLVANAFGTIVPCLLLLAMVHLRTGSIQVDLGLTLRRAAYDVRLGTAAFLLLAGLVYLIQSILFTLFPTQHPLLEMLTKNPEPRLFAGAFVTAALVAPICEEIFFRSALQGWLEKFYLHDKTAVPADSASPSVDSDQVTSAEVVTAIVDEQNPYASPQIFDEARAADESYAAAATPTAWTPIVISSALFALAHVGQGPAPVPLFVLAIGLGYLYQKTHRLLPCIVVHFLLNATSIGMLFLHLTA